VSTTIAVLAGAGIYETQHAWRLNRELTQSREQQSRQRQQIERERDELTTRQAALIEVNKQLTRSAAHAAKLQEELARLRADTAGHRSPSTVAVSIPSALVPPSKPAELPKEEWADAGFATPQDALRTRGWSVLNGSRERFKESVFVTDGARKTLEDMFIKMAEASNDPNKAQMIQQVLDQKLGVEDGILMPMMAENQNKGYTGYRVLSEQSPSADEATLEVETQMASAPARKETMKFRRFGTGWKVVIDEAFIKAPH
jgi:hypothetical protein